MPGKFAGSLLFPQSIPDSLSEHSEIQHLYLIAVFGP